MCSLEMQNIQCASVRRVFEMQGKALNFSGHTASLAVCKCNQEWKKFDAKVHKELKYVVGIANILKYSQSKFRCRLTVKYRSPR